MEDSYLEALPRDIITVLISKLDAKSLKAFHDVDENIGTYINWRDLYRMRYPYFIGFYNKIKKHDVKAYDYETYYDVLALEEISHYSDSLWELYRNIKYNNARMRALHLDHGGLSYTLRQVDAATFNNYWDVIQLLCELYVIRFYPVMYTKFSKYDFDIYEYSVMNNALYNMSTSTVDEVIPSIKNYIFTGIVPSDIIRLGDIEALASMTSTDKDFYIGLLTMVCILLEDNVKVDPRNNYEVVNYVETSIYEIDPDESEKVEALLAPIYHPDESRIEREDMAPDQEDYEYYLG